MFRIEEYTRDRFLFPIVMIIHIVLLTAVLDAFPNPVLAQLSEDALFNKQLERSDMKRDVPPAPQPQTAAKVPQPDVINLQKQMRSLSGQIAELKKLLLQSQKPAKPDTR
jgi:hypothetical protein